MRTTNVPGHLNGSLKKDSQDLLAKMNIEIWEILDKYGELLGKSENFTISCDAQIEIRTDNNFIRINDDGSEDHKPFNGGHLVNMFFKDTRNRDHYDRNPVYLDELFDMEDKVTTSFVEMLQNLKEQDSFDRSINAYIRIDKVIPEYIEKGIDPIITEEHMWIGDCSTENFWDKVGDAEEPMWKSSDLIPEED